MGISVIVMAYNEAASLEVVVREIHAALVRTGRPYEIVIVDDGSTDGTEGVADRLSAEMPHARVAHHPRNRGLGGVYRTGFKEARLELVTFFPADGQFPASIIEQFLAFTGEFDMVLGYLPNRGGSAVAKALAGAERLLYRALFGPMPKFQGIVMFRRVLLTRFALASEGRGWSVLMELILRASRAGVRIRSVPTDLRPRVSGGSKVRNLRTIGANLRQVMALRRRF